MKAPAAVGESLGSRAVCAELVAQFRLALPATLTYLLGRSLVSIGLVFIGRLGDLPLAASALANTTTNVSGLSILVGMGTAVSTICGQAYGAGNYDKVGKTARLSLLVFWTTSGLISVVWWHSEAILLLCGQAPAIAAASAAYIGWLIPFLFSFAAQSSMNAYLNAQRVSQWRNTLCLPAPPTRHECNVTTCTLSSVIVRARSS